MKLYLDCIPCIIGQALVSARLVTKDEKLQKQALSAAIKAVSEAEWGPTPMAVAKIVHRRVREALNCSDPYAQIKREHNTEALALYPRLQQLVAEADEPLQTAVKIAMAGNIMDLGVLQEFDVEATLEQVLKRPFAIDDYAAFKRDVELAQRVLYVADNAGEIVFDRMLLEQLQNKEITLAVKDQPFINDAMMADAVQVGIDELAEVIEVGPGAGVEAFGPKWDAADLIVLKGQANYEAYSTARGPLYFLLLAKCELVAGEAGVQKGDMILQADGG